MPEKIKFNTNVPGKSDSYTRSVYTLSEAISLIKAKSYPEDIEDALIKEISKQPNKTYEHFLKNIYLHLSKIQKKK